MAEDCRDMVKKFPQQWEDEERNEKLMYVYGHIAHIKSLVSVSALLVVVIV